MPRLCAWCGPWPPFPICLPHVWLLVFRLRSELWPVVRLDGLVKLVDGQLINHGGGSVCSFHGNSIARPTLVEVTLTVETLRR